MKIEKENRIMSINILIIVISILYTLIMAFSHQSYNHNSLVTKVDYEPWDLYGYNLEVDSEGNIYFDTNDYIIVIDQKGKFLYSYHFNITGSLDFYIDDEDNIIASPVREGGIIIINKEGTIIGRDDYDRPIHAMDWHTKYETKSGITYEMKKIPYLRILKIDAGQKQLIYHIPLSHFLVHFFRIVAFLNIACFSIIYYGRLNKSKKLNR